MVKKWPHLKLGDTIDVIATTPGIATASLEKDLLFLSDFVTKKIGLTPRINFEAILKGAPYFSQEAQNIRKNELFKALSAQDSKAIWCIRGGYGTSRLLVDFRDFIPPLTKLLIGYSDINCLHLWANKFWNWSSLHARVLYEYLEYSEENLEDFKNIIFGAQENVVFDKVVPINNLAKQKQNIKGVVTGGTVQVLQSGIGLPWQFDLTDKIVFLEEVFDRGVRLDRTLNHFQQLELFQRAKAIIFGDIICGKEVNGSEACDLAIENFARNIDIPVLHIPGIGHGKLNHPLPLNTDSELIIDSNQIKLICSTGGE